MFDYGVLDVNVRVTLRNPDLSPACKYRRLTGYHVINQGGKEIICYLTKERTVDGENKNGILFRHEFTTMHCDFDADVAFHKKQQLRTNDNVPFDAHELQKGARVTNAHLNISTRNTSTNEKTPVDQVKVGTLFGYVRTAFVFRAKYIISWDVHSSNEERSEGSFHNIEHLQRNEFIILSTDSNTQQDQIQQRLVNNGKVFDSGSIKTNSQVQIHDENIVANHFLMCTPTNDAWQSEALNYVGTMLGFFTQLDPCNKSQKERNSYLLKLETGKIIILYRNQILSVEFDNWLSAGGWN